MFTGRLFICSKCEPYWKFRSAGKFRDHFTGLHRSKRDFFWEAYRKRRMVKPYAEH